MTEAAETSAGGSGSFEEYSHFFEVRLECFDGPIDLLLHLVKQNELPIEGLSLAQVTQQYLECIEQARQFDLEIAGEYLVIASTLLSIKSSILLNEPVELIEDEDGNLTDPHEELLKKIRELEIYKRGAQQLGGRELLNVDVFAPPSCLDEFEAPPISYKQHDPMLLGKAFKRLLEKTGENAGAMFTITIDSVSIVERMMNLLTILQKANEPLAFEKLVHDVTSRSSIIGTFLALLELCKRQAIVVHQDEAFNEIVIALSSSGIDLSAVRSEFDEPAEEEQKQANNS